jgi:hypothetical protein
VPVISGEKAYQDQVPVAEMINPLFELDTTMIG